MDIILVPLIKLLVTIIDIMVFLVIVRVILGWLISFGVVNSYSWIVSVTNEFTYRVTEPLMYPIRRFMPDLGGLDLSPLVLILAAYFLRDVLVELVFKLKLGG